MKICKAKESNCVDMRYSAQQWNWIAHHRRATELRGIDWHRHVTEKQWIAQPRKGEGAEKNRMALFRNGGARHRHATEWLSIVMLGQSKARRGNGIAKRSIAMAKRRMALNRNGAE